MNLLDMIIIGGMVFSGWADRTIGGGLAAIKGDIITYFVLILLIVYVPSRAPLIASPNLGPFIVNAFQSMVSMISPGSYQRLKRRFHETGKGIVEVVPEKTKVPIRKDGPQ